MAQFEYKIFSKGMTKTPRPGFRAVRPARDWSDAEDSIHERVAQG
jgi:hypothetical protein